MVSNVTARILPVTSGLSHEVICWITGRNLLMELTNPCIEVTGCWFKSAQEEQQHTASKH